MYNINMSRKLFIPIMTIVLATTSVAFLLEYPLLLLSTLIIIQLIKHKLIPINKELLWFFIVGMGSVLGEIFLVNVTHAWSYANPHLLGVPFYAPLYWGILGTTLVMVYDVIQRD